MKIAVVQLTSTDDLAQNVHQIKKLISGTDSEKPEIIFFPENSLFFRLQQKDKVRGVQLNSPSINELKNHCEKYQVAIHFTTAIEDGEKVFNASVLIEKNGRISLLYKKMHLFDIELQGQTPIRESDVFDHGPSPEVFEFGGFKFGNSICYDVRFAELYSFYAKAQVDVILVPAAFLVKTGIAHWEILLRARAIESQCYLIAPAQSGTHKSPEHESVRETYGHSMLVDPWGKVLHTQEAGVGVFYYELNKAEIEKVRRQIPMHGHRRNVF
jgi:predicted amidohydrolase